ncbi:unnamed protein product [Orchesella dallaii]|uniref:RING-type E3 ubiquitin transferase n=1 Tax=Orchesella dallaii TaxID=48710 RepID=A0ABP1QFY0_9HEXA
MDKYSSCPICLEVPEQNIYQCFNGHVICNHCITKVGEKCPSCRVAFGEPKIRNRALESILDELEFRCIFQEFGCFTKTKRSGFRNHVETCILKPVKIPLCRLLGFQNCNFEIGLASRVEILEHFKNSHNTMLQTLPLKNLGVPVELPPIPLSLSKLPLPQFFLISPAFEDAEIAPLFLIAGVPSSSALEMRYICIQVWGHIYQSQKFHVQFSVAYYLHGSFKNGRPEMTRREIQPFQRPEFLPLILAMNQIECKQYQVTVHAFDFAKLAAAIGCPFELIISVAARTPLLGENELIEVTQGRLDQLKIK